MRKTCLAVSYEGTASAAIRKRGLMKVKVLAKGIGVSTLAIMLLVACGESTIESVESEPKEETETNGGMEEPENQQEEAKSDASQTETFALGDTVKFDDLQITLTNARVINDELFEPENAKFLAVELEIDNTGEEPATISTMLNMSLLTSDGYQQNQAIVDTKGNLDAEIGAGRKLKGEVAFDVEEAEFYEFIFEDPFTSGQAIWKIENADIQ